MPDTFTIRDFEKRYPNDDACLQEIFSNRYQSNECPQCRQGIITKNNCLQMQGI